MASARVLALVDARVADILAYVVSTDANATVERVYDTPDEKDLKALDGRKVWVVPDHYEANPETRGKDRDDHAFIVIVAERYTEAQAPPAAWMDERVLWTQGLYDLLTDSRGGDLDNWANEADGPMPVYDPRAYRELKMFWVEFPVITWRSIASA